MELIIFNGITCAAVLGMFRATELANRSDSIDILLVFRNFLHTHRLIFFRKNGGAELNDGVIENFLLFANGKMMEYNNGTDEGNEVERWKCTSYIAIELGNGNDVDGGCRSVTLFNGS